MIEVIDTLEKMEALKEEWERLEQNPEMRIFQTYAWCRHAWEWCVSKEEGAKLWLLRWSQAGREDTVIFPFYIDGRGTLRFIMDRHSDVCNAVYGERGNHHWCYKEVADLVLSVAEIKSVSFAKMLGESECLNYLAILLPGSVVNKDNAYSYLVSPKTNQFITSQSQLKSKDRSRLNGINRKPGILKIANVINGDVFPKEDILRLRELMLASRRRECAFFSDDMLIFIQKVYEEGKCEVARLYVGDVAVALAFRLLNDVRINYWIVLYEDKKTVTELYLKYMCEKATERNYVFDFGVGAYAYKLSTFRPSVGITFSLNYSSRLFKQLNGLKDANIRLLKDILKPRLKR